MLEAAKSFGVDDTVAIALKASSYRTWLLPSQPAPAEFALNGIRRKAFLPLLHLLPYAQFVNHQSLSFASTPPFAVMVELYHVGWGQTNAYTERYETLRSLSLRFAQGFG